MKQLILRDYQRAMFNFAVREQLRHGRVRINLFAGMGSGKSATTLAIIDYLRMFGYGSRALVVAPKRVASFTWPEEVREWAEFQHLTLACAVGGAKQRASAIASNADIVSVNFDVLPEFIEQCGDSWPFDIVVVDEATRLASLRASSQTSKSGKGFFKIAGGKQARALAKKAFAGTTHWINLTGSPGGKGLEGLYGMTWPLDAGRRLGRSFTSFQERWFTTILVGEEQRRMTVPLPHAQKEIQHLIRDISMVVEAKDFLDLPPLVESVVCVELPAAAMKLYKQFEEEMFIEIAGNEVEAFNSSSVTNKCRQIANGSCIVDETGAWELVHDAKIEALRECVAEVAGAPLLVSYQFKADAQRILKAFPQAVKIDDDPETLRRFNRGEIDILLAHPASAGHGISLQHACWNLVDFSTGWNLEEDEQIIERIGPTRQAQSGYSRTVYRRRLVAAGTIEEAVVRRIRTKMTVQEALREALK